MGIYKAEEWQSSSGVWRCGDLSSISKNSNAWYHPARIVGKSPTEFIQWLLDTYHPHIYHNDDCSFVGWYWDDQTQMRAYKNYINKLARLTNYNI